MTVLASKRSIGNASTSLADHAYDLLRHQIVTLQLKPLQVLSEKKLSQTIGVSRTPVREALARLAGQHLVDIYPQHGTFVAPLRRKDLLRSQFMREALEVALVERVAVRGDRTDLVDKLRNEVRLQQMFAETGQERRFYDSDEDFHGAIADFAGLPGIWHEIKLSKLHMDRCRHLALATVDKDLDIIARQHHAIIDAIASGDPARAAGTMRAHLRRILASFDQVAAIHPEYFEPDLNLSPATSETP